MVKDRRGREWYVAALIMEITVDGQARNVVHRNFFLVSARTPKEAYDKALQLGHGGETVYDNPDGCRVQHKFRGIAQLDTLVAGELADGAELMFEQHVGVTEGQIQAWILPKERLWAFRQPESQGTDVPDYSSKEILARVTKMLSRRNPRRR